MVEVSIQRSSDAPVNRVSILFWLSAQLSVVQYKIKPVLPMKAFKQYCIMLLKHLIFFSFCNLWYLFQFFENLLTKEKVSIEFNYDKTVSDSNQWNKDGFYKQLHNRIQTLSLRTTVVLVRKIIGYKVEYSLKRHFLLSAGAMCQPRDAHSLRCFILFCMKLLKQLIFNSLNISVGC